MKVKLLVSRAGHGFSQAYGSTVDVPAEEAQSLIAAGQAEALEDFPSANDAKTKADKADKAKSATK
jgi:hypothetical protein